MLSERLAFLISVTDRDAVRGFERIGAAAEKNLGKADSRLDRIGTRASQAGAGMLAFSGVAAGALFSFATASEDAERSQIELNATLANAPALAGESADRFNDLADAIQDKTAADGDAIVSGIAVLGNFDLTAQQLEQLTPLMVDYAARTGKDIPAAANDLGKALLGQGRALKQLGIDFEDAGSVGANFDQLMVGLSDKVGGFAEREGATFSGRLQRLKNELGDVSEGIGVGVVGALETLIGPATKFSDWLANTSPKTQELAGHMLAVGTAGIGAVGGLSLIAGQLVKLRSRFVQLEGPSAGSLNTLGKFARGAGIAAGIAGIGVALWDLSKASGQFVVNIEAAAKATDRELVRAFRSLEEIDILDGNQQMRSFQQLAEENIGTARRLRDALKAQGEDVSALDRVLQDEAKAQRQANEDTAAGSEIVDDAAGSYEGMAGEVSGARREIIKFEDTLRDALDTTNDVIGTNLNYEKSVDRTQDAIEDWLEKNHLAFVAKGKDKEANEELEDATLDAAQAILDQSEAARQAAEKQAELEGKTLGAEEAARIQVEELKKVAETLAPDSPLLKRVVEYIYLLSAIPREITTTANFQSAVRQDEALAANRGGPGGIQPGQPITPTTPPSTVKSVTVNMHGIKLDPEGANEVAQAVMWEFGRVG